MTKKVSDKGKKGYAKYKAQGRVGINRKRKIARHVKLHPEDVQAVAALAKCGMTYTRKKPATRTWKRSKQLMQYAETLSSLGYNAQSIKQECFYRKKSNDDTRQSGTEK